MSHQGSIIFLSIMVVFFLVLLWFVNLEYQNRLCFMNNVEKYMCSISKSLEHISKEDKYQDQNQHQDQH